MGVVSRSGPWKLHLITEIAKFGDVAQLVESLIVDQNVAGSCPVVAAI